MKQERLNELIHTPLTNRDLNKYGIDDANIILYSELDQIQDIGEFLPYDKAYKIILIEYEKQTGHWVLILRHNDTLEYFNSFGLKPSEKDFVNDDLLNQELNQKVLFLNDLFRKELNEKDFKQLVYNKKAFQDDNSEIMTCGRHVVNRLRCMLDYNMKLEDYI